MTEYANLLLKLTDVVASPPGSRNPKTLNFSIGIVETLQLENLRFKND